MDQSCDREYYVTRKQLILDEFDSHAMSWRPFLVDSYGDELADAILEAARVQMEAIIPTIPYIGGDENRMTCHLVRSTTSLALYKAMKARGKTAQEAGSIIYGAVLENVSKLPPNSFELTTEFVAKEKEQALQSRERRYPGGWVWNWVDGVDGKFDYGIDFLECGTQQLYYAHNAQEFLPFYCYLDFVTHRITGWGFARTGTLAEGHGRCDFRWTKGGDTQKGWPPSFLK